MFGLGFRYVFFIGMLIKNHHKEDTMTIWSLEETPGVHASA